MLQTCIRYGNSATKCQFCAIGESLKAGRTIAKKTPEQLAEVAAAAQRLDGIANVVMTIGTPPTDDRGAAVLSECAIAVKSATNLPIQAQCEPPSDFGWFARMRNAGVDSLGMHLEAWDENVRRRIMPGKAEVTRAFYLDAFIAAVSVFGRGQVSTYLLAVLGDTVQSLHEAARALIDESAHCRAVANALLRHCDRWRTGGTLRQLPALPIFDGKGYPGHNRGVTTVPGLYFLGLPWQYTWGSGRFSGVARDAKFLIEHIEGMRDDKPRRNGFALNILRDHRGHRARLLRF